MKTWCSIALLTLGLTLMIGGMLASNPQAPDASAVLARLPNSLTPWLLAGGALTAALGFFGLLGLYRQRPVG
jgi:hypothetical protein